MDAAIDLDADDEDLDETVIDLREAHRVMGRVAPLVETAEARMVDLCATLGNLS